jgi:diguanylate cyclase (GGDEF)-like protein/PAS domain S-box-containing protein
MLEDQFKLIFDAINYPILLIDTKLKIVDFNSAVSRSGNTAVIGSAFREIIPWAADEIEQFAISSLLETKIILKDNDSGNNIWSELFVKKIIESGNEFKYFLVQGQISGSYLIESTEEINQSILLRIIDFLPDPTFMIDIHGRVIAWNQAMVNLTHVPEEEILGKADYEYSLPFYENRRRMLIDYCLENSDQTTSHFHSCEVEGDSVSTEVTLNTLQPEGIHLWKKAAPIKNNIGEIIGAIETIRDITKMKKSEETLLHLSTHDPVTGLFNRAYFEAEIERLENSRRYPISVLFCELRSLKVFNEDRKYPVDDLKLKEAAGILRACFRREDLSARIGSHEFGVLMPVSELSIGKRAVQRVIQAVVSYNQAKPKSDSIVLAIGLSTAIDSSTLKKAISTAQSRVSDAQVS